MAKPTRALQLVRFSFGEPVLGRNWGAVNLILHNSLYQSEKEGGLANFYLTS